MSNIALELATSKKVVLATKQAFSKLAPVVEKNPVAFGVGLVVAGGAALYLYTEHQKNKQRNVINNTINVTNNYSLFTINNHYYYS